MRIGEGIEMIQSYITIMGKQDVVYPTVLWDKDTSILVDSGFGGEEGTAYLIKQFNEANINIHTLKKIILTHQDLDHTGGVPRLIGRMQNRIEVLAHVEEKPYIEGEKPLIKLTKEALQKLDLLPKEWREGMKKIFENPPKVKIDRIIQDSEEMQECGGVVVIHTPGHTPGHIALYHKRSKTVIAGDALQVVNGKLIGPHQEHSLDMKLATQSLQRFMEYEIDQVICYHGGIFTGNVKQAILELLQGTYS